LTSPAGLPARGDSQVSSTISPPNQPDGLRVAVGSLAVRSARPSGGLLSDSEPASPAVGDSPAAVNRAWDGRSPTEPTPQEGKAVEPTALTGREKEPDALVVIRGPGGFPLLGAVAMGHRRRNPAIDVGDFTTPPVIGESDPETGDGLAAQDILANSDIPENEGGDSIQSRTRSVRHWGGVPISVFSGLGVATVFTLNAVFSQPIAGFDYLTSRLDRNSGPRSGRKDRHRKPADRPRFWGGPTPAASCGR
jgi:hypothetical protein